MAWQISQIAGPTQNGGCGVLPLIGAICSCVPSGLDRLLLQGPPLGILGILPRMLFMGRLQSVSIHFLEETPTAWLDTRAFRNHSGQEGTLSDLAQVINNSQDHLRSLYIWSCDTDLSPFFSRLTRFPALLEFDFRSSFWPKFEDLSKFNRFLHRNPSLTQLRFGHQRGCANSYKFQSNNSPTNQPLTGVMLSQIQVLSLGGDFATRYRTDTAEALARSCPNVHTLQLGERDTGIEDVKDLLDRLAFGRTLRYLSIFVHLVTPDLLDGLCIKFPLLETLVLQCKFSVTTVRPLTP